MFIISIYRNLGNFSYSLIFSAWYVYSLFEGTNYEIPVVTRANNDSKHRNWWWDFGLVRITQQPMKHWRNYANQGMSSGIIKYADNDQRNILHII